MTKQIKRVKSTSKHEFERKYLNKATPLIISSGLTWKAFSWTPEYFKILFPDKLVDLEANYSISLEDNNDLKNKFIKKTTMKHAIDLIVGNKNPNIRYGAVLDN